MWRLKWACEDWWNQFMRIGGISSIVKIGMYSLWRLKEMNWRNLQWTCEDWDQFVKMEMILWRFEWACEDGDELVKIGISLQRLESVCEDWNELVKMGMSLWRLEWALPNIGINLWSLKRACEDCGMRLLYLDKVVHGGCGTKWRSHHHERLWQCSRIAAVPFNLTCMILWTCSWWCHNSQLLTPPL